MNSVKFCVSMRKAGKVSEDNTRNNLKKSMSCGSRVTTRQDNEIDRNSLHEFIVSLQFIKPHTSGYGPVDQIG